MITAMKKTFLLLIGIIFFFSVQTEAISKVCFNDFCFNVKLAKTPNERQIGLMKTPSLKKNEGMLFLYASKGYYSYWMKNMNYALDILWLNENREVVTLRQGVPPCVIDECPSYSSNKAALYVLEVPAGSARHLNITDGSKATFK